MLQSHRVKIVTPPDHLTEQTKDSFYQVVRRIALTDVEIILVNLEQVHEIDSLGLGILFAAYRFVKQQGHKLVLYSPQQQVSQDIRLTGLDQNITIYSTLRSCLQDMIPMTQRLEPLVRLPKFTPEN